MDPTARPRRLEHVILRAFGEKWVAYDGESQKLHVLNPTAAAVLHLCDGQQTPEEIADSLSEAFEGSGPVDEVLADVHAALTNLREEALIA